MKKNLVLLFTMLFLVVATFGQTYQTWRSENAQNSWQDAAAFWNFPNNSSIVFGQQEWDNNVEPSQINTADISTWRFLFKSGASSNHTFSGNKVGFYDFSGQDPMITNESMATHVINNDLECDNTAGDPLIIQIQNSGGFTFGGNIVNQGSTINIQGSTSSATTVTFNGIISGAGGIYKDNTNITLTMNGANTYSGQTTVNAGTLSIGSSGSLGSTDIRIGLNGLLELNNNLSVPSVAELGASNGGSISISADKTLTINGNDKGTLYQNSISGGGNLVMSGTGTSVLSVYGTQSYSGTTTINSGTLSSSSNLSSSSITINSGGTFSTAGSIEINDLTLNSGGTLIINSGHTLTINGNFINNGGAITHNNEKVIFVGISKTISGTAESVFYDLEIANDASVSISPTAQIKISHNLIIGDGTKGAGNLTIQSSSSGTGSLIVNGTATGNVTIERYIAAASWSSGNDGFHLISSPVAAEEISGEWTPTGSGNDYDFYGWSEANQTWVNKKNNDPLDPPTWSVFHPSTNFNIGQGYLVAYQSAGSKTFSGTLNNGNKQVTLTQSGTPAENNSYGYNLIGNPFSSALDWTNASWDTENNNYGGVAKIWSGGAYIDVVTADPVGDDVTVIPAMNGFFVFTSADDNLFTIPSAAQVHSANNWHKSVNSNHAIKLTVRGVNSSLLQGSSLRFNTEATNGFDLAFDSYFMAGYAPMFYSVTEGKNYSTNTLPGYDFETTIPFVFVKNEYTEFELELTNSIEGQPIFLTDNKTGIIHKLSENPVYTFTASEGDNPDRFTLHFGVTGLSDNTALATLRAYVSHGQLTILGETGELNVDVLDMQGRVLERRTVQMDGSYSQPLNLPAGVYVVRVYNGQAAKSVKVILTNR